MTCKHLWAKKQVLLHFLPLFQPRLKDVFAHILILCKLQREIFALQNWMKGVFHINSMFDMLLEERTILLVPLNP